MLVPRTKKKKTSKKKTPVTKAKTKKGKKDGKNKKDDKKKKEGSVSVDIDEEEVIGTGVNDFGRFPSSDPASMHIDVERTDMWKKIHDQHQMEGIKVAVSHMLPPPLSMAQR